nr:putative ribonuclease H-like domain-containing protein [Tanacetum cinerariifolium]
IENQMDHKVKTIRYDNGTKFKNRIMNEFYEMKGRERAYMNEFESMFEQDKNANGNRIFTHVSITGSTYVYLGGSIPEDTADLHDSRIFSGAYDNEVEGAEADFNNLELTTFVSPIPTTRIHKDHPKEQIIGEPLSTLQTRRMTNTSQEHAMVTYIKKQKRTKDYQKCLLACFLSQIEPKKVIQALTDPSWIEAMQDDQDKYVADILKKFDFSSVKTARTPIETNKALLKDEKAEDVDVYLCRSMIGSLMYLTASRPDIMFAVCACLWYLRDSPFDLEAFSYSDYAGARLDMKSTIGGFQFLRKRLISWQCKKQTVVANSTIEVEYVAAANCYGHVLWIQNQMLDYGFNFMNTKIYIDNESTICIVKNPVLNELMEITGSTELHKRMQFWFVQEIAEEEGLLNFLRDRCDELRRKNARRRILIRKMEALGERGVAVDSLESSKQTHARETAKLAALTDSIAETNSGWYP